MGWNVLVLMSKGFTSTWGTGLPKTLWKVVDTLIGTNLRASIHFHDILHELQSGTGMGTAITELNLGQYLASVYHENILLVLLDLGRAYDNVDRGCLIQTLEGYGAGTILCEFLAKFWVHQKLVP